jgi:hypothetical protein
MYACTHARTHPPHAVARTHPPDAVARTPTAHLDFTSLNLRLCEWHSKRAAKRRMHRPELVRHSRAILASDTQHVEVVRVQHETCGLRVFGGAPRRRRVVSVTVTNVAMPCAHVSWLSAGGQRMGSVGEFVAVRVCGRQSHPLLMAATIFCSCARHALQAPHALRAAADLDKRCDACNVLGCIAHCIAVL